MQADDRARRRAEMRVLFDLAEVHAAVQRRLGEGFAARGIDDVTPPQAAVLAVLFEDREATTARIAERLGLADVTVGRFVAALGRAGYVERRRNPADGREQLVRPTAKAYDRLGDFVALTNGVLDALFDPLDDRALADLGEQVAAARRRLGSPGRQGRGLHRLLPARPAS